MRNILIISFIGLTAFVLFSCSGDSLQDKGISSYDTQLQLKSVAVYNEKPGSASGIKSEFADGDTIGLLLSGYHYGNPFPFIACQHYWWQLSEPVFLSSEPIRISAFYPYRHKLHAFLSAKQVEVEHVTQTDYMCGQDINGYVNRERPYADIRMKHVLALVQFRFIKNDYPHDCSVQRVSIQNADGMTHLRSKGIVYLESGEIGFSQGYYQGATILPEEMNFYEPYTSEEEYARILVMPIAPVRNDGDLFFEFEIDGRIYTWPVKAGTFWESGMKYTYEVEVVPLARSLKSADGSENISVVLTQTSNY